MSKYLENVKILDSSESKENSSRQFILIALYLFFEYGRPQTFFPPIGAIRPALIIQIIILYYVSSIILSLRFKAPQTKSILLLLLIMVPHVFLARNNYWAFNILKIMFLYFVIYLAIIEFITKYDEIIKLIDIWLIIIFMCGGIGIIYGGKIPGSSIMGDENDFSLVMNMAIPIAFFLGLQSVNKKKQIFYFTATSIFIIATVLSFSRGGFVGLASVGLYCWIKSPKKLVSSFVIAIFILLISVVAPEKYWNEVKSITEENIEEGTGATRWYTWGCAWRMFLDYPIFGVGQGNFPWNIAQYEPPEGLKGRLYGGRAAHSIYFTIVPELGIVGTLLFCFITFKTMRESKYLISNINRLEMNGNSKYDDEFIKRSIKIKHIIYGLRGAMIGYLITGIFLSVLYYPHYWLIISLMVCIFNWSERELQQV